MTAKFGDKESIEKGLKSPIGYYRHNGPQPRIEKRHNKNLLGFSETITIPPGVYPIYPAWDNSTNGGEPTAYVEFTGKCTSEGIPRDPKDENSKIGWKIDIIDAIRHSGDVPNNGNNNKGDIQYDIYIFPEVWNNVERFYGEKLEKEIERLKKYISQEFSEIKASTTQLRYLANCSAACACALEVVQKSIEYQKNPTVAQRIKENTRWIPNKKPHQEISPELA